jgi:hypothetical protein
MSNEVKFADGFIVKRNETAPEFVLCSVSFKVDEAIGFLKANEKNGWVNVDFKKAQSGKFYAALNEWQPDQKKSKASADSGDLPWGN